MATTKGKNGTGLGLFMSYSNIKAHFNGNIRFETKKNKGTTTDRPSLNASNAGYFYYDTTINKPIWWNGIVWVKADGTNADA